MAKVHHQEGHVRRRIGVTITLAEIDAVDKGEICGRRRGQDIDVLQPQIAVRIARQTFAGTSLDAVRCSKRASRVKWATRAITLVLTAPRPRTCPVRGFRKPVRGRFQSWRMRQ